MRDAVSYNHDRTMKKINLLAALLAASLTLPIAAQKQFTLEDLNFGGTNYANMIPQSRTYRWWGDQLVRLTADTCWAVDHKNGKEKVFITRAKLNKGLGADSVKSLNALTFPYADQPLAMVGGKDTRRLIDFKARK